MKRRRFGLNLGTENKPRGKAYVYSSSIVVQLKNVYDDRTESDSFDTTRT